jgi:hypothetical protein
LRQNRAEDLERELRANWNGAKNKYEAGLSPDEARYRLTGVQQHDLDEGGRTHHVGMDGI